MALTEHGNTSSHFRFEKAATKAGIKPIYGLEAYTEPTLPTRQRMKNHLTLLAMDLEGYRNLNRAVTQSFVDFYDKPTILGANLAEHSDGLIVLSGCNSSLLACTLIGGKGIEAPPRPDVKSAQAVAERFAGLFGDRYYLEVQAFPELESTCAINTAYEKISRATGIPLVATLDVHYPRPEDNEMQVILHACGRGAHTVEDQARNWNYDVLLTLPETDDAIYRRLVETGLARKAAVSAVENTAVICSRTGVTLPKADRLRFPCPPGTTAEGVIWDWLREGWRYRGLGRRSRKEQDWYADRVKYEMKLVGDKDFIDFFLATSDVVRWAKDHGIPVGPGRGSAAASVVCWLLRITEVDPYRYPGMLFERFMDVNRADPPDIDLDFSDERRHEVREYLEGKYGSDCVGTIANFIRYRAKNALVDVARVHDIPFAAKETVSALIIERSGGDSRFDNSLEDTVSMFPNAQKVFAAFPDLWKATRLEGNVRGWSIHAAGLVVANSPLTDICATYEREGRKVLSIDKYDVEDAGMLKMDFLGLSTMGMISRCLDMTGLTLEDLYAVPDDDPETLAVFKTGDVVGIFQFEGRATRVVNRDVGPDNFSEVADVNALSRPGPLFSGTTAEYCDVKHGRRKAERYHPVVDDATRTTYGQIIYQEQILRILVEIGGFNWFSVGQIRRIISKKLGEAAFQMSYNQFEEGAAKLHGIGPELAMRIWKKIVTSGTYSFCCTGDTILEKAGAGRYDDSPLITVKDLHDRYYSKTPIGDKLRYGKASLLQMDDDGRVRPARFMKIHHPRPRRIVKLVTDTGRTLRCSREHPLMTLNGYIKASELRIGNEVIVGLPKEPPVRTGPNYHAAGSHWDIVDGERSGSANPGWIDGRSILLKEAQRKVTKRSKVCEHCKSPGDGTLHGLEFAHIRTLESLGGNYGRYHSEHNILHLCNSCHKKFDYAKGERVRRWTRGRPTGTEVIVSVEDAGIDLVYDIEMRGPGHNYMSNGFISHNNIAHAISYSMIAWWCAYLKTHYPAQFYAACLAKSEPGKEGEFKLLQDARRHGIEIRPPSLRHSLSTWDVLPAANGNKPAVLAGFTSVPGIAERTASVILAERDKQPFSDWPDLVRCKGIGPKTMEAIRDFSSQGDPFNLDRTRSKLLRVWRAIKAGEIRAPLPTHSGEHVAEIEVPWGTRHREWLKGPLIVFAGIVKARNYQDTIENIHSRSGDDLDEIRKRLKRPDLVTSCVLQAYDSTLEEVYLRINRWSFPRWRRTLESVSVGHDVVIGVGHKTSGFGNSIAIEDLYVIDPD